MKPCVCPAGLFFCLLLSNFRKALLRSELSDPSSNAKIQPNLMNLSLKYGFYWLSILIWQISEKKLEDYLLQSFSELLSLILKTTIILDFAAQVWNENRDLFPPIKCRRTEWTLCFRAQILTRNSSCEINLMNQGASGLYSQSLRTTKTAWLEKISNKMAEELHTDLWHLTLQFLAV